MNIKQRVNALFNQYSVDLSAVESGTAVVSLASAFLENGTEIKTEAEEWKVGVEAYVENEEGEKIGLPDGTYILDNGTELVIVDGVITEWTESEVEEVVEEEVVEEELSAEPMTRVMVSGMIAEAILGFETELAEQRKKNEVELSQIKLSAATKGVQRSPSVKQQPLVPVDLTKLSTKQRISHLYNQYNNK